MPHTQPWLQSYPEGIPASIDTHTYPSLVEMFEHACARFAMQTAVSNFGTALTFAELDQLSRDFAAWLQQDESFKKEDRIALMLPNTLQYYVAMLGALRAGLIVVNVNPLYTAPELIHQLNDANVSTIFVMANFAHTVEVALPHTSLTKVIVTKIGDLFPFPRGLIFNTLTQYIKRGVPTWHIPSAFAFKKILAEGKKLAYTPPLLQQTDIAFLQYTGGTTGISKGAILTHGNILANVEQALTWMKSSGIEEGKETILVPLPLYHIFSLTVCAFCFLKLGAHAILITNPRDIPSFMRLLAKTPYSVLVGINTLFHTLLQQPSFSKLSFASLKLVVTGGMPLQKAVAKEWQQVTGVSILEGYGLTEASPILTINPPYQTSYTGSIGLPLPSTDITLRNAENEEVPLGETGELCAKGPQIMRGYWHNDAETQLVFTPDEWLKTGDIAYMDAAGFLYIVDRKKDMISVSGFKVFPHEIEEVIAMHPEVEEVAVLGIANPVSGEVVRAYIVPKNPALTAEEIIRFCKTQLTGYKIPRQVMFLKELPKSSVGKILKWKLL